MYLQSPLIPTEVIKKVHPSFPLFENNIILPLSLCCSGLIISKPPNCSASVYPNHPLTLSQVDAWGLDRTRKKHCLWRPFFLTAKDKLQTLPAGPGLRDDPSVPLI